MFKRCNMSRKHSFSPAFQEGEAKLCEHLLNP